eukprot:1095630_1
MSSLTKNNTHNRNLNCPEIWVNKPLCPFKNPEYGKMSCDQIDRITSRRHVQFFARERPLFAGENRWNKAELCSECVHRLPFRNPLYRSASTLSEFNHDQYYYPFEILVQDQTDDKHIQQWIKAIKHKLSLCEFSTVINLKDENKTNHLYRSPEGGHDFSTFIS